jgi:hypothetical protein
MRLAKRLMGYFPMFADESISGVANSPDEAFSMVAAGHWPLTSDYNCRETPSEMNITRFLKALLRIILTNVGVSLH